MESGLQLLWLAFADLIDDRVTHSASLGVGQVEAAFRSAPLSCPPIALAAAQVARHTLRHVLLQLEVACMLLAHSKF